MNRRIKSILRHVTEADDRAAQIGDHVRVRIVGVTEEGNDTALFEKDMLSLTIGKEKKGLLRPAIDSACVGMKLNQVKTFVVRPGDASHPQSYRDPELCVSYRVPSNVSVPTVGSLGSVRHENRLRLARVTKVNGNNVVMDMNDPLAGHVLTMTMRLEAFTPFNVDRSSSSFPEPFLVPQRNFNSEELSFYDGTNPQGSIYIAVRDLVYDVTQGRKFYGKDGMYGFMAGKDATVCLAKFSLNPKWINLPWKGKLSPSETDTLRGYVRTVISKYPCVGRFRR